MATQALQEWEAADSRMIEVCFVTKHDKIIIIQCYTLANDHDDQAKDAVYNKLQAVLNQVYACDINLGLGDFNAQVGGNNLEHGRFMGKYGIWEQTNNGERIIELGSMYKLCIGGGGGHSSFIPENTN